MRTYVSIDMEGVAGVAHPNQTHRGADDYPRARELMCEEANAAIAGAFDGGADAVVVNDSHGDMMNLIPERIDPRAELVIGSPKVPQSMMQGLDETFSVALFIGYHARAGTAGGILAHTYWSRKFYELRINGEPWSECDLNAAVAGAHGVPVGLVTGDELTCQQAQKRLPGIRTVDVKRGLGATVAQSLHPSVACDRIRAAAVEAVAHATELRPFVVEAPVSLEIDFTRDVMADVCALTQGAERNGRTVRYKAADVLEAHRIMCLWAYAASGASPS